jgi:type IV secretion system protein VirB2
MKKIQKVLLSICAVLVTKPARAAGGGSGLPWEAPLTSIANSMTGPVAFSLSLIGIVVAGGMLVFGGEINEFARRAAYLALAIGVLIAATNLLNTLFAAGAVV